MTNYFIIIANNSAITELFYFLTDKTGLYFQFIRHPAHFQDNFHNTHLKVADKTTSCNPFYPYFFQKRSTLIAKKARFLRRAFFNNHYKITS